MRRLGELERAVMQVLWDTQEPLTARDVSRALSTRDLAYTTVMTVLDRLTGKELVRRVRVGRAWQYRPAASREAYVAELMMEALSTVDDRDAALVHFVRSVTPDEAAVLRDALGTEE